MCIASNSVNQQALLAILDRIGSVAFSPRWPFSLNRVMVYSSPLESFQITHHQPGVNRDILTG